MYLSFPILIMSSVLSSVPIQKRDLVSLFLTCWFSLLYSFTLKLYWCDSQNLKYPYYAFSNITFNAGCHVAVCEHKLSAKL